MPVALPALLARAEFLDYPNLAPKLLALNNWILDGKLSGGGNPAYRSAAHQAQVTRGDYFKAGPLNSGAGSPSGTAISELVRTALAMVDDQIFLDGNTRTATLVIFEYLASVDVLISRNAIKIYWLLAQRKRDKPNETLAALQKEVQQNNYKPAGGVTAEQRVAYTAQVKSTEIVWTGIEAIHAKILAVSTQDEKREIAREEKRKNRPLYDAYLEIYGPEP